MKQKMRAVDYALVCLCWISATVVVMVVPEVRLWQIVGGILYSGLICLSLVLFFRPYEMITALELHGLTRGRLSALVLAWLLSAAALCVLIWVVWLMFGIMTVSMLRWSFVLGTFLGSCLLILVGYLVCMRKSRA